MPDQHEIASALHAVPADDRATWLSCAMAVKSALGDAGFDLWDAWSQQSDRYNERDARDVWRSIKPNGATTVATLFKLARDNGWTRPAPAESRSTAIYAKQLWLAAATDDATVAAHPYCQRKGVQHAAGAGRVTATGKLIGERADVIVIPIRRLSGELVGVECINREGIKQSFGAKSQGCLLLGSRNPADPWAVVEGWADGASWVFEIHDGAATAAVAFGKGRLLPLADDIAARFQPARLMIAEEPQ